MQEDSVLNWDLLNHEKPKDIECKKTTINSANDPKEIGIQGHILQFKDIATAIKEQRSPRVDGIEGRKPIELICAIYESSMTEKIIYL